MQPNYKTIQDKDKNMMKYYPESFDVNDDIQRPSNFIVTNFNYHSKKVDSGSSSMPQKLKISRPKKVSKK